MLLSLLASCLKYRHFPAVHRSTVLHRISGALSQRHLPSVPSSLQLLLPEELRLSDDSPHFHPSRGYFFSLLS